MEKYIPLIQKCPLFAHIDTHNLPAMLHCIGANVQHYKKNQDIFSEGAPATHIGVILSGQVQIVRIDYYGNRSIVANLGTSHIFGESFACAGIAALPVSVTATCDSTVLLMNCQRILKTCSNACTFHSQIIYNLMKVVATKNIMFNQKIEITSKRSTREKLIAFLLAEATRHQSDSFTIPYDRQALADYLGVERSGLSMEISKLRNAGLIEADKNRFHICKDLSDY